MHRLSNRAAWLLAPLFALGLALAPRSAPAQPKPDCQCADAADLYARYCSSGGAIREWNRLISRVRDEERKEGRIGTFMNKNDVAQCVDEVIAIHRDADFKGTRTAGGVTLGNDCRIEIKAPTACLTGVIQQHEAWHRMQCEAHKRPDAPWRSESSPFGYLANLVDRMAPMSLIDYMLEERTGYMIERNYVRNKLEELAQRCPLQGMFENTGERRSFTLKACPAPDYAGYAASRKCTRM